MSTDPTAASPIPGSALGTASQPALGTDLEHAAELVTRGAVDTAPVTVVGAAPERAAGVSGVRGLASVGRDRVRQRTSDLVYDELAAAIRDVRIPPGAALSETDLAEQLHVSRTPLREAIARLVDAGLVLVVPQVGTRVEPIRPHDVEQARFVRESLETAAFAAACARPPEPGSISVLRELLERQARACETHDLDAFFAADEALHEQIFTLSGYRAAWQLMQPLKMHLDRLRRLSLPDSATVRALIDEHIAIVDALEAGDSDGGRAHIRSHARRVMENGPVLRAKHPEYFA